MYHNGYVTVKVHKRAQAVPAECDRTDLVTSEAARIRPYQPGDLDELYRICVQTADNGQDATTLFRDPRLPGHVYAAPYAIFEPSLAFVAQDAAGVAGYIVAALDTRAFEQRLEGDWWPALRASHPDPSRDLAEGLSAQEKFALHAIHHPWATPDKLARRFPSELHINLVPRLQGQGNGATADGDGDHRPSRSGVRRTASARQPGQPAGGRVLPAPWLRRASGGRRARLHHGPHGTLRSVTSIEVAQLTPSALAS